MVSVVFVKFCWVQRCDTVTNADGPVERYTENLCYWRSSRMERRVDAVFVSATEWERSEET